MLTPRALRIALEDPLQVTLAHNYYGMKHLLEGVSGLPGLAGIVHVSTAFVNCCKPLLPEGTAEERVYPLKFGDREVRQVGTRARRSACVRVGTCTHARKHTRRTRTGVHGSQNGTFSRAFHSHWIM